VAEIQRIAEKLQVLAPTPQAQKLPIAPIFIADSVSLAVSREKNRKLRIVYAGWDTSDAARGPSTPSFNHLVGSCQQHGRHGETERLGGHEVDGEFVPVRGLHGQIGRFLAF
jgi:hypothetical protein